MATLKIYYQNVRGLRTKTNTVFRGVCLSSYDIIIFTETWLDDSFNNSELFDGRYLVWRRDRDYSRTGQLRGGGVLIAVKHDLTVVERLDWRSSAEDIWLSLILKRSKPQVSYNLHICALYLCKENLGNSHSIQLRNFTDNLNNLIVTHPLDKFLLVGDFNFGNDVEWCNGDIVANGELIPQNISSQHVIHFIDAIQTFNLSQYNGERNINCRLLDLVFCNDTVTVSGCTDPLALPIDVHHKPLIIQTKFIEIQKLVDKPKQRYIFAKGNYDAIKSELDLINWPQLLQSTSLEDAVTIFYSKLYELRDRHIPLKSVKQSSYPPWYTPALIKIIREKHKFHIKYKRYSNLSDYYSFSLLCTRVFELDKTCYDNYMANIEASIAKNPKSFWTFVKSKQKDGSFPNEMFYRQTSVNT